jgi:tetratricopeptide (TPR) repeat protein
VLLSFGILGDCRHLPDVQRLMKGAVVAGARESGCPSRQPAQGGAGALSEGLILTEMGRPADAIAVFTKLAEDYPELPEPYNNLAVLYAQQKQYDKARTALEMAIRTHPSYSIAHENLGDVYAKLASQAYDKALQLDSSNAATQSKLSMIRELISTSSRASVKPGAAVPRPTMRQEGRCQPARAPTSDCCNSAVADSAAADSRQRNRRREGRRRDSVGKPRPLRRRKSATRAIAEEVASGAPSCRQDRRRRLPAEQAGVKKALLGWAKAWSART